MPENEGRLALYRSGEASTERLHRKFQRQFPALSADRSAIACRVIDECLNETLVSSLEDARSEITKWKEDYNKNRPHSSLGNLTPNEFAAKMTLQKQTPWWFR